MTLEEAKADVFTFQSDDNHILISLTMAANGHASNRQRRYQSNQSKDYPVVLILVEIRCIRLDYSSKARTALIATCLHCHS